MGEGDSYSPPTPQEFEQARRRELARLNVRLLSITGVAFHTSEDLQLLEGDTSYKRASDQEVVRRWTASSEKYGGEVKKLA